VIALWPHAVQPVQLNRATFGPPLAPVQIVEYGDFNCGHCQAEQAVMNRLLEKYPEQISFTFKHLPILAKESRDAALYMEAIALQSPSAARAFYQEMFLHLHDFRLRGDAYLVSLSKQLHVDARRLRRDRASERVKHIVDNDIAEAHEYGFSGTPGFLINGALVEGEFHFDIFDDLVEAILVLQRCGTILEPSAANAEPSKN